MNLYVIFLRLIHIFGGVFWAGTALALAGFITPAVRASRPEGGKFMQRLVGHGRLPLFVSLSSWATTVAGVLLYWCVSGGLRIGWMTSPSGLSLTVGAAAGLLAFALGLVVQERTAAQLAKLGQASQAAGVPPTAAQVAQIQVLQRRLTKGGIAGAVLLAVSVMGMAVARFVWWYRLAVRALAQSFPDLTV